MTDAIGSRFVYVTYIRTTPDRLWSALTSGELAQQYWLGARPEADWRVGGSWKLVFPDGRLADTGEIVAFEPPKRLSIRWRNEFMPELKAEGWSLCTMELEPAGEAVKLTVTHSMEREGAKFINAVSGGWPQILSNLKSLLETGSVLLPPQSRAGLLRSSVSLGDLARWRGNSSGVRRGPGRLSPSWLHCSWRPRRRGPALPAESRSCWCTARSSMGRAGARSYRCCRPGAVRAGRARN